jgi:PKHD-type hydroxylase
VYTRVPKLLNEKQVEAVNELMDKSAFSEGAATGGPAVQEIKNNKQLDRGQAGDISEIDNMILQAIWNNALVHATVLPSKILHPYYAKYEAGMAYGPHVDNPVMGSNPRIRTDVSISIFLCDPEDYEGGELVVNSDLGDAAMKMPKGGAIIYPTGAIHSVKKVEKGERRVIVTWIQSMVADPYRRRMLYDIDMVCRSISQKMPQTDEHRTLMRTYGNLLRLWGEV